MINKLTEVDMKVNHLLNTAEGTREFNIRYLFILMTIALIKKNPDIKIYRSHEYGEDVLTVISSEIQHIVGEKCN